MMKFRNGDEEWFDVNVLRIDAIATEWETIEGEKFARGFTIHVDGEPVFVTEWLDPEGHPRSGLLSDLLYDMTRD